MTDYYEVLGVKQDATMDDIKKAYRALMLKHHPDHNNKSDPDLVKAIQEAFEVLSDPRERAQYDNNNPSSEQGMVNTVIELIQEGFLSSEDPIGWAILKTEQEIVSKSNSMKSCSANFQKLDQRLSKFKITQKKNIQDPIIAAVIGRIEKQKKGFETAMKRSHADIEHLKKLKDMVKQFQTRNQSPFTTGPMSGVYGAYAANNWGGAWPEGGFGWRPEGPVQTPGWTTLEDVLDKVSQASQVNLNIEDKQE